MGPYIDVCAELAREGKVNESPGEVKPLSKMLFSTGAVVIISGARRGTIGGSFP